MSDPTKPEPFTSRVARAARSLASIHKKVKSTPPPPPPEALAEGKKGSPVPEAEVQSAINDVNAALKWHADRKKAGLGPSVDPEAAKMVKNDVIFSEEQAVELLKSEVSKKISQFEAEIQELRKKR